MQNLSSLHPSLPVDPVFYISGRMTGLPEFNYPFFHALAKELRGYGFNILSPAEIDGGAQVTEGVDYTDEKPYSYYLKKAMHMMCNADAIIMTEGWTQSKGARRELDFMLDCGMPAFRLERGHDLTDYRQRIWLRPIDDGIEMNI